MSAGGEKLHGPQTRHSVILSDRVIIRELVLGVEACFWPPRGVVGVDGLVVDVGLVQGRVFLQGETVAFAGPFAAGEGRAQDYEEDEQAAADASVY